MKNFSTMITDAKFERGITLLQQHFNRTLSDDAIAIWREFLDDNLGDEEFAQAIKEAILSCDFFPTAKKLVEFAAGSLEVAAIQQWQIVVTAATTTSETWVKELLGSLSERSRMALQAIGGLEAVAISDEWLLKKLEKQFATVYCQSPTHIKFLPPAKIQPIKHEVVESEMSYAPSDLSTRPEPVRRMLETLNSRVTGIELSDKEAAINRFAMEYQWNIDENRLNHYLEMDKGIKMWFVARFRSLMKDKPSWRSASVIFDEITGYKPAALHIDAKAIARQWLEEQA